MFAKSGIGTAILPDFDFSHNDSTEIFPIEFDFPLEYGAGYLKSNPEKKLIDRLLKISKECIDNLNNN